MEHEKKGKNRKLKTKVGGKKRTTEGKKRKRFDEQLRLQVKQGDKRVQTERTVTTTVTTVTTVTTTRTDNGSRTPTRRGSQKKENTKDNRSLGPLKEPELAQ